MKLIFHALQISRFRTTEIAYTSSVIPLTHAQVMAGIDLPLPQLSMPLIRFCYITLKMFQSFKELDVVAQSSVLPELALIQRVNQEVYDHIVVNDKHYYITCPKTYIYTGQYEKFNDYRWLYFHTGSTSSYGLGRHSIVSIMFHKDEDASKAIEYFHARRNVFSYVNDLYDVHRLISQPSPLYRTDVFI